MIWRILFLLNLGFLSLSLLSTSALANERMTPEKLWQVKRVSGLGLNKAKTHVIYKVTTPSIQDNSFNSKVYQVPLAGGSAQLLEAYQGVLADDSISPDGNKKLFHESVAVETILATDKYPDLVKADGYVFDDLNYRHWDTWKNGSFKHVFYQHLETEEKVDIMDGEAFDSPTSPFGGSEDYIWGPEGKNIYYVSKKLSGTQYVTSTNTDIYRYNLASKTTTNITQNNPQYQNNEISQCGYNLPQASEK